jgi:flagellar protein FlaG
MSAITPSDANKPSLTTPVPKEVVVDSKPATDKVEKNSSDPVKNPYDKLAQLVTRNEATPEAPSRNLLNASVSEMNDFVQSIQRELQFSVDEDSGRTVVKVIDKSTNEVIRQVPPEDLMAMLKEFSKPAQPGLIFKNSA